MVPLFLPLPFSEYSQHSDHSAVLKHKQDCFHPLLRPPAPPPVVSCSIQDKIESTRPTSSKGYFSTPSLYFSPPPYIVFSTALTLASARFLEHLGMFSPQGTLNIRSPVCKDLFPYHQHSFSLLIGSLLMFSERLALGTSV